jgi:Family of unknown function (DUF6516)
MNSEIQDRITPFFHLIVAYKEYRYKRDENFQMHLDFQLLQGLRLIAREYEFFGERRKYSFHVQDSNNILIFRYDNEPHWASIPTFPHHKHLPHSVEPSVEMTLEMVFAEIEQILKQ